MTVSISIESFFDQRYRDVSIPFVIPDAVSQADMTAAIGNFAAPIQGQTIGSPLVWNGLDWTNTKLDATGIVSAITLLLQTGSAAPTTGAHTRAEVVWNTAPSAGGTVGWVCVSSGTPGTWKTFGSIAA